jgi:hypothetical protein
MKSAIIERNYKKSRGEILASLKIAYPKIYLLFIFLTWISDIFHKLGRFLKLLFIISAGILLPIILLWYFNKDAISEESASIDKNLQSLHEKANSSLDYLGDLRKTCNGQNSSDVSNIFNSYISTSREFAGVLTDLNQAIALKSYCSFYGVVNLANNIDSTPNVCSFNNFPNENQIKSLRKEIKEIISGERYSYASPSYRIYVTFFTKSYYKGYTASNCLSAVNFRSLAERDFHKTKKNDGKK